MLYLSLGLNLPAQFAVDPWFVVKRAAAHSKASVSCGPSYNLQQFANGLFPINCRRSPKLITWSSTSPLQSEVLEATSPKSSMCLLLPTTRKRPVRRQRLPKILISDEDCTLDMASTDQVAFKLTSINPTAFIPLTEEQSGNFHIFNELLAEHNGSATSTPSLSTSKLPSTVHNSSRATKRSLSNSELFTTCAPSSKKSKPTLHWTEILDNLMTASDWEEVEEELQKQADQNDQTSLNQTVSFIPLTEEESKNFHIFNELLAEHQVSSISNPSLLTSKLLSSISDSQLFTTRAPISKTPKPTLHWSEILDDLMTASDWEEAEVELQSSLFDVTGNKEQALNGETCASVPLEFMPLTSLESSNFDIFNALVLEHQLSETSKSSPSSLATTNSSPSSNTKASSNPKPSKLGLKRRLHWSEILDSLMTDEDQKEADELLAFTLPISHERPLASSSTIPSSYSSAENTHSHPTPVEELNDPFEFIINTNQNFCYHADMSFDIVKSCSNQNDNLAIDLGFNIEKSFFIP